MILRWPNLPPLNPTLFFNISNSTHSHFTDTHIGNGPKNRTPLYHSGRCPTTDIRVFSLLCSVFSLQFFTFPHLFSFKNLISFWRKLPHAKWSKGVKLLHAKWSKGVEFYVARATFNRPISPERSAQSLNSDFAQRRVRDVNPAMRTWSDGYAFWFWFSNVILTLSRLHPRSRIRIASGSPIVFCAFGIFTDPRGYSLF